MDTRMKKETVNLNDLHSMGLIVLNTSDKRFTNQAGGTNRRQYSEQGSLSFIDDETEQISIELSRILRKCNRISLKMANQLDDFFASSPQICDLRVNRERLPDSTYGWIYVYIVELSENGAPVGSLEFDSKGVLTWNTSKLYS